MPMSDSAGLVESRPSSSSLWSGSGQGIWAREPEPKRDETGSPTRRTRFFTTSFVLGVHGHLGGEKRRREESLDCGRAKAHTIGNKISLGDDVRDDRRDARTRWKSSHTRWRTPWPKAAAASTSIAKGTQASMRPTMWAHSSGLRRSGRKVTRTIDKAGPGGADVHRWEAGEHVDAVANAAALAKEDGKQVSDNVTHMMSDKIEAANGMEVTPGGSP